MRPVNVYDGLADPTIRVAGPVTPTAGPPVALSTDTCGVRDPRRTAYGRCLPCEQRRALGARRVQGAGCVQSGRCRRAGRRGTCGRYKGSGGHRYDGGDGEHDGDQHRSAHSSPFAPFVTEHDPRTPQREDPCRAHAPAAQPPTVRSTSVAGGQRSGPEARARETSCRENPRPAAISAIVAPSASWRRHSDRRETARDRSMRFR